MTTNRILDMDASHALYMELCPEPRQCWRFALGALFLLTKRQEVGGLHYVEGWISRPGRPGQSVIMHGWLADDQRIVDPYAVIFNFGSDEYFPAAQYTPEQARARFRAQLDSGDVSLPFIADDDPMFLAAKQLAIRYAESCELIERAGLPCAA